MEDARREPAEFIKIEMIFSGFLKLSGLNFPTN
jgi:hypothetical protein